MRPSRHAALLRHVDLSVGAGRPPLVRPPAGQAEPDAEDRPDAVDPQQKRGLQNISDALSLACQLDPRSSRHAPEPYPKLAGASTSLG
jgi:hypothetical protein